MKYSSLTSDETSASTVMTRAPFLSRALSKLRLCSANHRPGHWSNLPCDWLSTAWAYSRDRKRALVQFPHIHWAALEVFHYSDVIMSVMVSQITSVSIVYWNVCSGIDQREQQSSTSLAFVRVIHQWLVNSPHKGPVMRKMFSFDDVIMLSPCCCYPSDPLHKILY